MQVLVDDIDPNGKLSLSMVGEPASSADDKASESTPEVAAESDTETDSSSNEETAEAASGDEDDSSNAREYVSFEEHFSETAKDLYGDMGPESKDDGRNRRRRRNRR